MTPADHVTTAQLLHLLSRAHRQLASHEADLRAAGLLVHPPYDDDDACAFELHHLLAELTRVWPSFRVERANGWWTVELSTVGAYFSPAAHSASSASLSEALTLALASAHDLAEQQVPG